MDRPLTFPLYIVGDAGHHGIARGNYHGIRGDISKLTLIYTSFLFTVTRRPDLCRHGLLHKTGHFFPVGRLAIQSSSGGKETLEDLTDVQFLASLFHGGDLCSNDCFDFLDAQCLDLACVLLQDSHLGIFLLLEIRSFGDGELFRCFLGRCGALSNER